jgi:hypothetical protein
VFAHPTVRRGPETLGITFHILEQRGWGAEIVNAPGDRAHFQIPIDLGANPLRFFVLFRISR